MVREAESESLEEAFRKYREGSYRPHSGPSSQEFESYKEGGTDRKGASFKTEQEFGESQSLEETYKKGFIGRIKGFFQSNSDNHHLDLGEETEGRHGVIDPSDNYVPEIQYWIDKQLEGDQPDYKAVERVLAAEAQGKERVGVLEYVDESDLTEDFSVDELEVYSDKSEYTP